jgi:hypothetical protein
VRHSHHAPACVGLCASVYTSLFGDDDDDDESGLFSSLGASKSPATAVAASPAAPTNDTPAEVRKPL